MDPIYYLLKLFPNELKKVNVNIDDIIKSIYYRKIDDNNNDFTKIANFISLSYALDFYSLDNLSGKINTEINNQIKKPSKATILSDENLSIFHSKDAIIMSNLDSIFKIIRRIGGMITMNEMLGFVPIEYEIYDPYEVPVSRKSIYDPFLYLSIYFDDKKEHIGGIEEYLCWRLPTCQGMSIAPRSGPKFKEQYYDSNRTRILWGSDGTGNYIPNRKWIVSYIRENERPLDLVIANASILKTDSINIKTLKMLTEMWISILILQRDGQLLLKVGKSLENIHRDIIFILSQVFIEIGVVKPISSHDIFVYCRRLSYKYLPSIISNLNDIIDNLINNRDKQIYSLVPTKYIDSTFITYYNKILNLVNKSPQLNNSNWYLKVFSYWQIPGNKDPIDIGRNSWTHIIDML
jgi:hypothetical protein